MTFARDTRATVIPTLRYRNALAAIDWLCQTFGFERSLVVPGANPSVVVHAQLSFGNGMVMLGLAFGGETTFGRVMQQPDEAGGRVTQSIYVVVNDADAVHARARAAGADIFLDIEDKDYGGRDFSCRDSEGHVWTFGTYDPWS